MDQFLSPAEKRFLRLTTQDCVYRALKRLNDRLTHTKSTSVIKGHLQAALESFATEYEQWTEEQYRRDEERLEEDKDRLARRLEGVNVTQLDGERDGILDYDDD